MTEQEKRFELINNIFKDLEDIDKADNIYTKFYLKGLPQELQGEIDSFLPKNYRLDYIEDEDLKKVIEEDRISSLQELKKRFFAYAE
jgi:hypothetical protein